MNRSIKFRCWDVKAKEFVDDCLILPKFGHLMEFNKCEFWGEEREIILSQFTGQLDSQGKEIYEGDLLISYYFRDNDFLDDEYEKFSFERNLYIVKWWSASFRAVDRENYHHIFEEDGHLSKIIGNIFETPELMDNKNKNRVN